MTPTIDYIAHSTFMLTAGDARVLLDPFLAPSNRSTQVTADDVDPTHILITHGHFDHIAHAPEIAKRTGAHCVAITELAGWLVQQGVAEDRVKNPNLGGTVAYDWGKVKLVPAWHTNTNPDGGAIGSAAGLMVTIGGKTIWHLGDTALFGDLRLIGERHAPDVALVPIGGHFTMDREDAAYACNLIGAPIVIPCHYNTFPPIETDPAAFKADAESATDGRTEVVILAPGESYEL